MNGSKPSLKTCRICGSPTGSHNPAYPFCGEGCRERDLGNWASETYRVAAAAISEEEQAEMERILLPGQED